MKKTVLALFLSLLLICAFATPALAAGLSDALDGNPDGGTKEVADGPTLAVGVRLADAKDQTWHDRIDAEVGDIVEYRLLYANASNSTQRPSLRIVLPDSLQYLAGSTTLYNVRYPDGASVNTDQVITDGISIGTYAAGSNAYVTLRAEVAKTGLEKGNNTVVAWARLWLPASQTVVQDSVELGVNHQGSLVLPAVVILLVILALAIGMGALQARAMRPRPRHSR